MWPYRAIRFPSRIYQMKLIEEISKIRHRCKLYFKYSCLQHLYCSAKPSDKCFNVVMSIRYFDIIIYEKMKVPPFKELAL